MSNPPPPPPPASRIAIHPNPQMIETHNYNHYHPHYHHCTIFCTHSQNRRRFHITTLSNTRVDKPAAKSSKKQTPPAPSASAPPILALELELNQAGQSSDNETRPSTTIFNHVPRRKLSYPNTALDPEFSYDYETYMTQVANHPPMKYLREYPKTHKALILEGLSKGVRVAENTIGLKSCIPFHIADDISPRKHNSIKCCSFGLELLDLSETVIVRQCHTNIPKVVRDAFHDEGSYPWGFPYEVSTRTGSPLLYMTETTNCLNRMLSCSWVGLTRSFTAKIVDVCGKPSMTVTNVGLDFCCCCTKLCCCCRLSSNSNEFKITLADGELLGSIGQTRGEYCHPGLTIRDENHHRIINGSGPKCTICDKLSSLLSVLCCCFTCLIDDDVFYFMGRGGKQIAQIRKSKVKISYQINTTGTITNNAEILLPNSACLKSEDNDVDIIPSYQIVIDFAPGVTLKIKAMILAASFVIDFIYWQSSMNYASVG